VTGSGRSAKFEAVARISNVDAQGVERADPHGLAIRIK
jgi:hypothetical protein